MNTTAGFFISVSLTMFSVSVCQAQGSKPYDLRTDFIRNTEYYTKDGYATKTKVSEAKSDTFHYRAAWIRTARPSFGWVVPGKGKNIKQTAFRLIVADNPKDASASKGNVYDSGVIEDDVSTAFVPQKLQLRPDKAYYWRVMVATGKNTRGTWSDVKLFRTFAELNDSATSHEPLVKTLQEAKTTKRLSDGSVLADFALDAFAQPIVEINAEKDTEITVFIGETLGKDGHVDTEPGATIRGAKYEIDVKKGRGKYRIKPIPDKRNTGVDAVKIPDFIGEITPFRFCEVNGDNASVKSVKFYRETVTYPLDCKASSFVSDSKTLNDVFEFCKYSLKATSMLGIFVDGDRERIAYEADAVISMLGTYFAFGDAPMARRSVRHLIAHPTWPTEWSMQTVELAAYDYLFTGDNRLAKQNYGALEAHTLSALRCENGLISTVKGGQTAEFLKSVNMKRPLTDIVDWPAEGAGLNEPSGGERDGFVMSDYNSVVNAWHYRTLKRMVTLSQACGNRDKALAYNIKAEKFKDKFNSFFLDDSTGLYRDGISTNHFAAHSNFYAAAFGLVPNAKKQGVAGYILKRGMACSVFGSQFLIDGLFRIGKSGEAIKLMQSKGKRSWVNMMRSGATITMEDWDRDFKPNLDWNHAWATAPANIAFRGILGIIPTAPAYGVFAVFPQIGELKKVSGSIKTLRGTIKESVEADKKRIRLKIEIPANAIADVSMLNITSDFGKRKISCAKVNGKKVPLERLTSTNASYTLGSGKHTVELLCD